MKKSLQNNDPTAAQPRLHRHGPVLICLLLAALTIGMFRDVLFTRDNLVLSKLGTDLSEQYVPWRMFGFDELRKGNLALWNPHLFSGSPYFGGFQSALLYPLNALFLVLPLAKAINVSIALHVLLGGLFMYAWMVFRGLLPLAGLLASVGFMFCGPHFLHIYAGHLSNLCAMVWTPLLLLAIDGLTAAASWKRAARWALLGAAAATLQILAGHPQYVFFSAVAATLYFALRLIAPPRANPAAKPADQHLARSVGLYLAMYAGAALLAAVQLLPGLEASSESIRSGGVGMQFAAMFSLPPENLLTLLVPELFGTLRELPYWGRCYLWEMSLFISVTALALALYGFLSRPGRRTLWREALMVALLLTLALGAHTPLFAFLYDYVPGFDLFRGLSKFTFPATLFLLALAAHGLDRLIRERPVSARAAGFAWGTAALLALLALTLVLTGDSGWWRALLESVQRTGECYLQPSLYDSLAFRESSRMQAAGGLGLSATVLACIGLLFHLRRFSPRFAAGFFLLAAVELLVFARLNRPSFPIEVATHGELRAFLSQYEGDYRILHLPAPNAALAVGARDLWGYDPGVPRRYARLMTCLQGNPPDSANQFLQVRKLPPLLRLLRCRFVFVEQEGAMRAHELPDPPLPRALLVNRFRVVPSEAAALAALTEPAFDPALQVILEQDPGIRSAAAGTAPGTVRVTASGTDFLDLEAECSTPALLLVTDTFAKGWKARSLAANAPQPGYQVLPADSALMAVPLQPGSHRLRLYYLPDNFRIGRWISSIAAVLLAVLAVALLRPDRNPGTAQEKPSSKTPTRVG